MPATTYRDCLSCKSLVDSSAAACPFCGANLEWLAEERRLAREYLRCAAAAIVGGTLAALVFLAAFGLVQRYIELVAPLSVALVAMGAAVWMAAGNLGRSSPTRE